MVMLIHETSAPVSYNAVRLVLLTVIGTKGLDGFLSEEESLLMVFFIKTSNTVDKFLISLVDEGDSVGVLPGLSPSLKTQTSGWSFG